MQSSALQRAVARLTELTGAEHVAFLGKYARDPAAWMRECIAWPMGSAPTDYQLQLATDLMAHERMAIRAPRGTGKTTWAALIVLWYVVTREMMRVDWKVVTTASVWRQLEQYLWPEIHLWAKRLRWEVMGRPPFTHWELHDLSIDLAYGSAFAVASNDPARIEGAHAAHLLWMFDESKAIPDNIFDAAEGSLSTEGGEQIAVAVSTPGRRVGRFYEMFRRRPGLEQWHPVKVTIEQAVQAGRISQKWVDKVRTLWGENSTLYRMQVLAEFGDEAGMGIIPLDWVEAAVERWHEWQAGIARGNGLGKATSVGVDVGQGGPDGDPTAIAIVREGLKVESVRQYRDFSGGTELMQVAGLVGTTVNALNAIAYIDSIGIGAGVVARLREMDYGQAVAFNSARPTMLLDGSGECGFFNWRSAMWWLMREALDPHSGLPVCLPPEDDLLEELTTPNATLTSDGRHRVESKDDIKKRLKRQRSTNCADAVLQALFGPILQDEYERLNNTEVVYMDRQPGQGW